MSQIYTNKSDNQINTNVFEKSQGSKRVNNKSFI